MNIFKYKKDFKIKRNSIFTTLSQQILDGRLLLTVMSGQKSNLICEFKLELIITFHLWFVVKNIVNVTISKINDKIECQIYHFN